MTPQQVVAIFIRFASLWFVVLAFQALGVAKSASQIADIFELSVFTKIIFFVYIVLAFVFWLFPMAIAHFLVPNTKFENTIKLQPYQTIYVACVVLGLWVCLINALPLISIYVSSAILLSHQGQPLTAMDAIGNHRIFTGLIQLIVGLLLIFKAEFISKKIINLQSGTLK